MHLFTNCTKTVSFQDEIIQMYNQKLQTNRTFNEMERLLKVRDTGEKDTAWENILTMLNKYIWHRNNQRHALHRHGFHSFLKETYNIEKDIAYRNGNNNQLLNFLRKWEDLIGVLEQ